MRAAKNELAKRRAWLGVTALGMLACSLALAGAPGRRPVPDVKEPPAPMRATDETNAAAANSAPVESEPAAGMVLESRDGGRRVQGGQMPAGQFPVIANMVVDYRDDDMSRARTRGELIGPLPLPSEQGGVATGGCTFSIECDDANPCTLDICNLPDGSPIGSGKCEHNPVPDGGNAVFGGGFSLTCITTGTCGCDNDNYCDGYETCQGAVCAPGSFRNVGLTCDSHDDCREPGVCNLGTGQCTSGDTGACATNDDCGIPSSGTCNPGTCDTTPQTPTCCDDRDYCHPEFGTCDLESENTGDPCDSDSNCRGGRCNQCAGLCASAADCADTSKCNGVETCVGKVCYAGANNGTPCVDDSACTGGGKCLGTCARGAAPCGYIADCEEGRCSAGVNANKTCSTDGNCPGSFCLLICMGGPNNGFPCGNTCPGGACNADTSLCEGGLNAGRGCADCEGSTCGSGPSCSKGRCCSAVSQPVCTQSSLGGNTPPGLCVGNWYAGDGGNDLQGGVTEGLCGGANATGEIVFECPKYSGGLTQTNLNNIPQRLVTVGPVSDSPVCIPGPGGPGINGTGGNCVADPDGPAGKLNKLGDDYTLTDSSHIGLEVMRWVGGPITALDRILIEFYDASNIFVEDIVMVGVTGTDIGVIVVQFNPPLTIPPSGSVVARTASNFAPNTRFRWVSTSNPVAVGTNNPNSLWVNNGPAANFLSPNPGTLAFELAGNKVAIPSGACCNARTGECVDGAIKWVCANQGNIFNGVGTTCASCHAGPGPVGGHLGTCRECVGGTNNGNACLSDTACGIQTQGTCNAGFCTAGHPPTVTCNVNDDCDKYFVCGPDNASCQPHPGGNVCSNNPNRLCPATACDPPGTCGPPICVALAACGSGACCNPTTGDCTPTTQGACTGTFQGFGTACDADNGLGDSAEQHCCPQPSLGMKCMGGPNNLDPCTSDLTCRFCVGGPNDTDDCIVHTDCARCVGGTNPDGVCTDDDDCPGNGVCTGHCLGNCVTRGTGADNCEDAFVHHITVPLSGADPVTITISGNNETASNTVENPDVCSTNAGLGDPAWWEAIEITDCAFVRIDYCCSKPVHEPVWAFVATDCTCDNTIGTSPNPQHDGEASGFRGPPYCDEDNFWGSYGPLQAGTYYFPIYSALAGTHDDYVVHVTVEACLEAACCMPDGSCHDTPGLYNQGECDAAGGYFLAPPQLTTAQNICLPSTCEFGSCCLGPGECLDQESDLPGDPDDDDPMTRPVCLTDHPGASWFGGVRCFGGTCSAGGDDAGESCRTQADCEAPSTCVGSTEELALPSPCPLCEHTGLDTCDIAAGQFVWLSDTSAVGNPTRQANDIQPTETALLTTLCVKGVYLETIGPGVNCSRHATDGDVSDSFTVRLYAPDPTRYFPGLLLGQWATTHVTNRPDGFNALGTAPCNTNVTGGGFCYADYQLTLTATAQYPLVELQSGQIYFIEFSNNTTGGQADCDWWNLDAAIGQGNDYAFLDTCGTTYTEDSVKVFTGNPNAMRDPTFCMNVAYVAPPSPVRACCTGDPITPCVESTVRECAVLVGQWQFDQLSCGGGFVCPVEPNDLCDKAPFVKEGEYEFDLFGATQDGTPTEQCEDAAATIVGGDIWFYYQPTASGLAYIGTCDCERGADEVVLVYHDGTTCHCPGDPELDLLECYDGAQITGNWLEPAAGCPYFGDGADVIVNVEAGHCYTVRVATFTGLNAGPANRGNLRIALNPDECGNNQLDNVKECLGGPTPGASCLTTSECGAGGTCVVLAGEQCDGTVTVANGSACDPADCRYNCLCPPPVCGKQCVGGAFDGQPCDTIADCPLGGTSCEGKLDATLGESCDTTAGAAGIAPCTFYSTTCRPPGDVDGECTCVPSCGNGRREGGEICDGSDDANCGPGGSCTGLCLCNTVCGNGILEIGEQCDKGGPGATPPPSDALCKGPTPATTRCQADCTCPEPSCGNNFTETLSNDEECDGTDLAGESTCPGEQCRPPGDPSGECTCACAGGTPANTPSWAPTKSCIAAGASTSKACIADADCGLCTLKKCSGLPANTTCTGTGTGTCAARQCSGLPANTTCTGTGQGTCPVGQTCDATGQTCNFVDCVTTAGECTPLAAGTCTPGPAASCVAWPNNSPLATTRDLRFTVVGDVGPSKPEAIKVTMVDLQHPRPANLPAQAPPNLTTYDTRMNGVCNAGTLVGHHCDVDADCPPGVVVGRCSSLVGCTADPVCTTATACTLPSNSCGRWVGKLGTFYEAQGPPVAGPYKAARLQCTPYYWDWKPEGLINVVGADVAPSSEYSVQVYGASCMGVEAGCTDVSAAVPMYTRRSGDVEGPFNPPSTTGQPDVTDIAQLVNKFKNLTGAPVKAISQLQPNLPELNADINALDIVAVVDSVKGLKWAFSGPCACPSLVTCGLTACPSGAGVCVTAYGAGSTCVKTCTGPGPLAGDSCINNTHCVGSGTCGTAFCRDRCGRCKP